MSFSFSSLVRLIVLTAVGLAMLAVGLSRLDPSRPARRIARPSRYYNVNEYYLNVEDRAPRWVDSETGQLAAHPLDDGDVLEAASCSPWVDEMGRHQVIGRWSTRTTQGPLSVSVDFGLARYTFPEGRMLDHVSAEAVPVGPPCWFPGTRARILFSAGDGKVYHYAFESENWARRAEPAAERDLAPRALVWRCPKPGTGNIFLSDLTWPSDPRMGGCVVVSLREQDTAPDGPRCFSRARLWWLKLNFAGTEIVEAGPMVDDGGRDSLHSGTDERCPTVGALSDGQLTLFYLKQRKDAGWELWAAPVEVGPDHHAPRSSEAAGVVVATGCQPAHPILSSDGRWLDVVVGSVNQVGRVARFPTSGLTRPAVASRTARGS